MQPIDKTLNTRVNDAMWAIKNGDESAVTLLFELTYKSLYHVAYKYAKDRFMAEDLTADIFANINYIASRYSQGKNAFNYLCKALKNRFLNVIRYRRRHSTGELCDNLNYAYENIDERVSDIAVREALKSLDKDEFDIINMKFYMEKTFREIADEKGLSLGKVQRIYNRAAQKLKTLL